MNNKTQKITAIVAKAIADSVMKQISLNREKTVSQIEEELKRSKKVAELKRLHKTIKELHEKAHSLSQQIKKEIESPAIEVTVYRDGEYRLTSKPLKADRKEIANAIIIANHVHGVEPSKLADYVAAKFK